MSDKETNPAVTPEFRKIKLEAAEGDYKFRPITFDPKENVTGFTSGVPLLSRHTPEVALGKVLRKYPTLELLPAWQDMVENVGNGSKVRTTYIEGPPGVGKTEIGFVLADAMGADAAHILCESGKNLSDLLVTTSLDAQDRRPEHKKAEDQIARGEISPMRMTRLKAALSAEKLGLEQNAYTKTGKGIVIDWDALSGVEDTKKLRTVEKLIDEVIAKDLPREKGSSIGAHSKDGKLMVALKNALDLDKPEGQRKPKPTVIIFDEFSRRGNDGDELQNFFEVIGGSPTRDCYLTDAAGNEHHITNQMLRDAGVYFVFSANPVSPNDPEVRPMPPALKSRLDPIVIRDYGTNAFQTAFEREVFGVPISMAALADEHAKDYATVERMAEWARKARSLGMQDSDSPGPERELSFIHNHDNVRNGLRRVAEFLNEWRLVEDPDSPFYTADVKPNPGLDAAAMREEAGKLADKRAKLRKAMRDEKLDSRGDFSTTEMGLRMAIKMIHESWEDVIRPDHLQQFVRRPDEPMEERFGDFLVHRIQEKLAMRYPDPENPIRQYLESRMLALGIEHESSRMAATQRLASKGVVLSNVEANTVGNLLNTSRPRQASEEARGWRDALVDYLKAKYKGSEHEIADSANAQSILPDTMVDEMLNRLPEEMKAKVQALAPYVKLLPVVQAESRRDEADMVQRSLGFGQMQVIDTAMEDEEVAKTMRLANESTGPMQGPDARRVVMTLGLPGAAERIADELFLTGYGSNPRTANAANTEDLKILENRSNTGLALTTLQTEGRIADDGSFVEPENLHVIRHLNKSDGRQDMLIVGEKPLSDDKQEDNKLRKRMKHNNITYVARTDTDANEVISAKVDDFVALGKRSLAENKQTNPVDIELMLSRAFRHRNPPSPNLVAEVAKAKGVSPERLSEEQDIFKGKTIVDLLGDTSLTITEMPVLLREKEISAASEGSKAASVAGSGSSMHTWRKV